LLKPLPIPHPQDFRYVGWAWAAKDAIPALTDLEFEFVRDQSRIFDAVATYRTQEAFLGDETTAQPVRGMRVTNGFFRVVGVAPDLGRAFNDDEFTTAAPVVVLGNDTWRSRFGADSAILGRQVRLDGELRTVIGVLPRKFQFPPAPRSIGYIVPFAVHANPRDEGNNTETLARLRPGTSAATIHDDVSLLTAGFRAAYPAQADSGSFRLYTHLDANVSAAEKRTLWTLLGTIGLVLLIACANTATLLLIRASARQREIAVRASIGASAQRILQQLLTEGVVLSAIATTVGVLFSVAALRAFLTIAPNAIPAGGEPRLDARVLVFASAISIVTALAFGLTAAGPAFRARLSFGMTHGGAAHGTRLRHGLVFLQTAIAVVLMAGASLLAASFARLVRVEPGFDVNRVVAVRLGRLPKDYDAARREQFVERVADRIRMLPDVEEVAAAPNLPLERGMNFSIDIPDRPDLSIGAVELRYVSPSYLRTLGIPLRAGRSFDRRDVADAEPVAIVNEAFARHYWQDSGAVGRMIQIGHYRDRWNVGPGGQHPTNVIGVAADIHEVGLDRPAKPTVLVPRAQNSEGTPVLLVRGSSRALPAALREAVIAEEPRLAPAVEPLSTVFSRSVAAPRFRALLVGSFAVFALLLAGIGIYGVIASGVQYRRREIAVRMALGASSTAVATTVAKRCLSSVAGGAVVGLAAFWATRRVLSAWLFNIAPGDPLIIGIAVAALAIVAALASWIPTRRATRLDPVMALRLE
ncbi:MAG TPA: ADOP family duplicated permease, partial [Gemmatimonadaceae bacterium]|nr:ADOP family duplicated permease [Gemmatimonadaceae bacterium]